NAEIHSNSGRGPPGNKLKLHDLTLSATASVDSSAKAIAKDKDATTVGIGAGVAINIVDVTTTALIDSGATFDGSPLLKPQNVTLTATGTSKMTTRAEAGTEGKPGSDAAITPDVAISYPTIVTTTSIAGGSGQNLAAAGSVSLTTTQTTSTTTDADASAGGSDVAIGLALALAIVNDEATATIGRNIAAGGAVSAIANATSDNGSVATASAKGAKKKSA